MITTTHWIIAGLIVAALVFVWRIIFPDEPSAPTTKNPEEQAVSDYNHEYVLADQDEKWGKSLGHARTKRRKSGMGASVITTIAVVFIIVLLGGLGYSALDSLGLIKSYPKVVGPNDTCVRNGEELYVGVEIQVGDKCNGKTIEPTPVRPTMAPTQTTTQPAATQTSQTEAAPAPIIQSTEPTPIPKLPQAVTYGVLIKENGVYGMVGYPFVAQAESLESLKTITSAPCGQEMAFESDTVYALVYTDDALVNAKVEVTPNGITVSCEYGTVIYAELIKP